MKKVNYNYRIKSSFSYRDDEGQFDYSYTRPDSYNTSKEAFANLFEMMMELRDLGHDLESLNLEDYKLRKDGWFFTDKTTNTYYYIYGIYI